MPWDPNTGYPFITYYFRTHFICTNKPVRLSLALTAYVDDGAVFYLNGAEIYRLLMPAVINNSTLATNYYCRDTGNATCPIYFTVPAPVTNLVVGDNIMAVEVHNYNARSPDITFGTSLATAIPYATLPQLGILYSNGVATLNWARGGFTLQQANAIAGPWSDVPGPIVSSPFTTTNSSSNQFFRLRK
jgi:hypothetical protein